MHRAIFFFGDVLACHSAFLHFSLGGHTNTSMTHQVIEECIVFTFPVPYMDSGTKNMHDWALLSTCGVHLSLPVRFPKLLVRIRQTLAGEILTSAATATHKILRVCSSADSLVPCGVHSIPMMGLHYKGIIYLFWSILNGIHALANSFI
jgi:hypothetical protein